MSDDWWNSSNNTPPGCSQIIERLIPGVNRRFGEGSAALRQHFLRYRLAAAYLRETDLVLDAGCGSGYGAFLLGATGARVVALDRDHETIEYARRTYAHERIQWVEAALEKWDGPPESFHRIVCFETIEHVPDPRLVLGRLARLLRAEGVLLISAPIVPSRRFNPYHLHDFSEHSFVALLKSAGFRALDQFRQEGTYLTVVAAKTAQPDLEPRPIRQAEEEFARISACPGVDMEILGEGPVVLPRVRADEPVVNPQTPASAGDTARIGVCVLTYNSASVVGECLRNLSTALRGLPHDVVVVDNNSSDGTAETVRAAFPEIQLVQNAANAGYAQGNNLGARYLLERGCSYLAFVNPDASVQADTLQRLQSVLFKDPRAGCAGAAGMVAGVPSRQSFRNKPTPLQRAVLSGALQFMPLLGGLLRPLVRRLAQQCFIPADRIQDGTPVYAACGACLMFPAWAFVKIEGFDPHTFLFQEELIVSERLRRIGCYVVGVPGARYSHLVGHSVKGRALRSQWHFIRSEQYFVRAYDGWAAPARLALLVFRCAEWLLCAFAELLRAALRLSRR